MILLRYFSREIFQTTATVTAIVLVIAMGWRFGVYLEQAAAGRLSEEILFALVVYRLPGFLELIVPVSFFLAIMLVFGRLYVDNEMIVLQASGVSMRRIITLVLLMTLAVMAVNAVIAMWMKPLGEQRIETLLSAQQNLTEFDMLQPGRFQVMSTRDRVTYTQDVSGEGELTGVFINEFPGSQPDSRPRETITVIAESGKTQVDELGQRFLVLNNGKRYRGVPGERAYRVVEYEEYGQVIERSTGTRKNQRNAAIPTLSLFGDDTKVAVSELQWRLSVVLVLPVLALMAIPLSRVNPRQGRFTRLLPAMILCFIYIISLSSARSGLEKGNLPAGPGMWWIHGIFVGITLAAYRLDAIVLLVSRLLPLRRHPSQGK